MAPLVILVFSGLLGLICALVSKSVKAGNVIISFFSVKLFMFLYLSIAMGKAYLLVGWKFVFVCLLVTIYFLVLCTSKKDFRVVVDERL
ncbi:DUF6418 domain-containing protein [Marinobacter lutaoensis]|uniref:DUF6418 domain-containing protein n=1 Tax=Marinobacter lutaoensis TaxID=135739 RepID=UPI0034A0BF38